MRSRVSNWCRKRTGGIVDKRCSPEKQKEPEKYHLVQKEESQKKKET